jgi:membrane-bound serine protease (ClpP class)
MKHWLSIAVAGVIWGTVAQAAQVGLIKIDGAIGPATANYVSRAIKVAASQNDECLIVELNTPGGLGDSMNDIVQDFYQSPVPTVVYVAPEGAMAGSAGCYITLAADVAAMAPHTTIGAAHPVEMGFGESSETTNSIMMQKVGNAYTKVMQNIAEKRHRNVKWAESSVTESKAITSEEALKMNVIDLIAKDVPDLLKQLNGRKVGDKTLHTAGAEVVEIPMTATEHIFQLLWRPEVMFVLMLIAIYGIIGELSNPGAILPGVVGALALILLLYMSATLPVNIAGVALILLAVALFIIDIFTPTHGVLTGGGVIAFFLGAMMLFNGAGPGYHLSMAWIVPATVVTAAFFIFVVGAGLRAQFKSVKVGKEMMVGRTVNALSRIDSQSGRVFIEGEIWNAVSETPVETGQPVEVIGIEGLTLKVKPKTTGEKL